MPNRPFKDSCRWSPTLDQLSLEATAMFYPLVLVADDYGCFDADPRFLLSLCFPLRADRITRDQVAVWRNEMGAAGLIELYGHNDHVYGHFVKWDQHQKPHNTSKRKHPEPKVGNPIVLGSTPKLSPPKPTRSHSRSLDLTRSHSVSPPAVAVAVAVEIEDAVAVEIESEDKESTPSGGSEKPAAGTGESDKTPGAQVFEAYEVAYKRRWRVAKVPRNREINSQCKALAEKLGKDDAVAVARWYVESNEPWYVQHKHPFGLLVRDAQKLWTEWSRQERVSQVNPKTAGNLAAAEALLAREGRSLSD